VRNGTTRGTQDGTTKCKYAGTLSCSTLFASPFRKLISAMPRPLFSESLRLAKNLHNVFRAGCEPSTAEVSKVDPGLGRGRMVDSRHPCKVPNVPREKVSKTSARTKTRTREFSRKEGRLRCLPWRRSVALQRFVAGGGYALRLLRWLDG
jgi:hypothetical protein